MKIEILLTALIMPCYLLNTCLKRKKLLSFTCKLPPEKTEKEKAYELKWGYKHESSYCVI